jgi:hypothetical protein
MNGSAVDSPSSQVNFRAGRPIRRGDDIGLLVCNRASDDVKFCLIAKLQDAV